jgi:uncharacterized protein (TIGR03435 family)
MFLAMVRFSRALFVIVAFVLPIGLGLRFGQVRVSGQEPARRFETASVRPSGSEATPMSVATTPGRFTATNIDVRNLITVAYRLPWFRIVNAPSWPDRYDIVATMPPGTEAQHLGLMLQQLLEERFLMQAHVETRQQPVYTLVMVRRDGRLGPEIRRSEVDCATRANDSCHEQVRASGHVVMRGMSLDALANYLSGAVQDRVVLNRTGLEGSFDIELRFAAMNGPSAGHSELPSLFTAIQEQLGLMLEPSRGPVEVLVVDSIARPSSN